MYVFGQLKFKYSNTIQYVSKRNYFIRIITKSICINEDLSQNYKEFKQMLKCESASTAIKHKSKYLILSLCSYFEKYSR